MKPGTYVEKLAAEEELTEKIVVEDSLWVIMVLDDGHQVRFQHSGDHVDISTPTGVLNIRPDSSNSIEIGVPPLGSPAKGTSYSSK